LGLALSSASAPKLEMKIGPTQRPNETKKNKGRVRAARLIQVEIITAP
jgi:hypothetical protein